MHANTVYPDPVVFKYITYRKALLGTFLDKHVVIQVEFHDTKVPFKNGMLRPASATFYLSQTF